MPGYAATRIHYHDAGAGRKPIFAAGVWIVLARPFESPRGKALRLCGECGLGVAEIDGLIDDMRHSTLTRAGNLALFRSQYEREADAEYCADCAAAVLDASKTN